MTLAQLILNVLFAILVFFIVRFVGSLVTPDGQDRDKVINAVAVIVAVVVFIANFADQIKLN